MAAAAEGIEVRAAGSGLSYADQVATEGLLVSLEGLDQPVSLVDGKATVQAGMTMRSLNAWLTSQGQALANLADMGEQTVSGAISTGTHGTGRIAPHLSSQVVALEIVTADGRQQRIDRSSPGELAAARVSLGALGVITAVTFEVVPAFSLRRQVSNIDLGKALGGLDEWVDANERCELLAWAYTGKAVLRATNPDPQPPRLTEAGGHGPTGFARFRRNARPVIGKVAAHAYAGSVPYFNRATVDSIPSFAMTGRSDQILVGGGHLRGTGAEWAVPRVAAVAAFRELLRRLEARRLPVNGPLQLRFTPADTDAFLSPAWGRETAYLGVNLRCARRHARPIFEETQAVALSYDGRPHWGKVHQLDASRLRGRFEKWNEFQAVRARMDPAGTFSNAHVRRVLGPA